MANMINEYFSDAKNWECEINEKRYNKPDGIENSDSTTVNIDDQ
ncbi:1178_t:CDS:1, partial [Gigaspora rosea]